MTSPAAGFRSSAQLMRDAEALYAELFEASPLPLLVLTPDLRIANGNAAYCEATFHDPDRLAGLPMFEAFPDPPGMSGADGVRNLGASLRRTRERGRDRMAVQRYDVEDGSGTWLRRYWLPLNWAVRDGDGRVAALIHHVVDVTAAARVAPESLALIADPNRALLARADAAMNAARELRQRVDDQLQRAERETRLRVVRRTDSGGGADG
jgi:PAS domain-containing protein